MSSAIIKILGGVAVAGLIATGGSAFTGTGLATSGTASSAQFVGGAISQAVTGATLSGIVYDYTDATKTAVDTITLTFADALADGKAVTAVVAGSANNGSFGCAAVSGTGSICTYTPGADAALGATGVTGVTVTVAS